MDQLRDQLSEIRIQLIKDFQNSINAKTVFALGALAPAQNSDAFIVLQRPKYHLVLAGVQGREHCAQILV